MDRALQNEVRIRAGHRCEYRRMPEGALELPFAVDHIVARQHGGQTARDNLALSCPSSNRHKGPNIAGVDPVSKQLTPLFHPRQHKWEEHFAWNGPIIVGSTPIGRTTAYVLAMNRPNQIALRQALIHENALGDRTE